MLLKLKREKHVSKKRRKEPFWSISRCLVPSPPYEDEEGVVGNPGSVGEFEFEESNAVLGGGVGCGRLEAD